MTDVGFDLSSLIRSAKILYELNSLAINVGKQIL